MPDVTRLSEELLDLVLRALDHATPSIALGGAFIPFVMAESAARERDIERFPADTRETALKMAREHISQLAADAQRVALAYDGSVTIGGERSAAVLVEAHERGKAGSVIFAHATSRVATSSLRRSATPRSSATATRCSESLARLVLRRRAERQRRRHGSFVSGAHHGRPPPVNGSIDRGRDRGTKVLM